MMDQNIISKIGSLFVKAKNILIVLPADPSIDAVAAALALQISLTEVGKQALVACSESLKVGLNRLIGVDKVTNKIGSENLVVSFDYIEDSIEKVSYHIADAKFNLVIKPKEGFPPLDTNSISYSYTGANSDLIVVVGSKSLESIGRIYREEQKLFEDKDTINIDSSQVNTRFGKTNLLDPQTSSCSELVGLLIRNLNMPLNADTATNLLAGIETETNNLTVKMSAETFQLIADLMKTGGRRGQMQTNVLSKPFDTTAFMPKPQSQPYDRSSKPAFQPPFQKSENNISFQSGNTFSPSVGNPVVSPKPFNTVGNKPRNNSFSQKAPSPDWLEPKIYKGSTQID